MNRQAMIELRRVVAAAPEHRLHMRSFREEGVCGTAYCAAGWAACDPWFNERGMAFDDKGDLCLDGSSYNTFSKLARFFEIDGSTASNLFAGDMTGSHKAHYVKKWQVLHNIDLILEGKSAEGYLYNESYWESIEPVEPTVDYVESYSTEAKE